MKTLSHMYAASYSLQTCWASTTVGAHRFSDYSKVLCEGRTGTWVLCAQCDCKIRNQVSSVLSGTQPTLFSAWLLTCQVVSLFLCSCTSIQRGHGICIHLFWGAFFFSGEGKGKLAISALVFLKGDLNSSLNVNRKALYLVGLWSQRLPLLHGKVAYSSTRALLCRVKAPSASSWRLRERCVRAVY